MKAIKNLAYATLATLGLGLATPNYIAAQNQQPDGISFYEHNDSNNNGIVDDGETSKLARIVFKEGENIAIDSKFKSGTGNLYVVSEKGKIMKTVPQQYDTGVKSSKLLENLPTGKYATVFQKDGSNDLAGSYIKVVGKGESLSQEIEKNVLQNRNIDIESRKNYAILASKWNDFTGDKALQNWEISNPLVFSRAVFSEGESPVVLTRSGNIFNTNVILKKRKDKSFQDFSFKEKKTRNKVMVVQLPSLTSGEYLLQSGQHKSKIKVL